MFRDDEFLTACRSSSITCLYEISSLWLECQRKKNSTTPDRVLGKKRMLKFLEQNQDPTRDQIVGYKNGLKAENSNDPETPRPTMEGEGLGIATIEQLVARGETFDTILVTPNDDHWAEIETSEHEFNDKHRLFAVLKGNSSINIAAENKRAALAIKLASAMGVPNPEIMIVTDEPIGSRAIPLDQATVIV